MPQLSPEFSIDIRTINKSHFKQKEHEIIRKRIFIALILILLSLSAFCGCLGSDSSSDDNSSLDPNALPIWTPGKYWIYTFSTPDLQDIVSKIVVCPDDGTNHQIGVSTQIDARRHAVLNFNPMLGRVRMSDLAVYEKGEPQLLFSFPLEDNSHWKFSLFGIESFRAEVVLIETKNLPYIGKTTIFNIVATATSGEKLIYNYDSSAQWIRDLTLKDSSDNTILEINLVSYGIDFTGNAYFVRGVDLYDKQFNSTPSSPVVDFYDSFVDQGHPDWGPFDLLIYYLDVLTQSDSVGSITLRDHQSETALLREFGPDTMESSLGTIPSESGEWTLTVNLDGNAGLRMRIAGGIEYVWTVKD